MARTTAQTLGALLREFLAEGIPEEQAHTLVRDAAGAQFSYGGLRLQPEDTSASHQAVPLPTVLQLAQTAYAAYGEASGGVNYQGLPMPAWDDLGDTIQRAWIGAAAAVRDEVLPTSGADQGHGMRTG